MLHEVNHRTKGRRASRVVHPSGKDGAPHDRPAFGSDDWMRVQQTRSEKEAKAWRVLRHDLRAAQPTALSANEAMDFHGSGSTSLKALVRFGLATFGAHFAWLAAAAFQLGQFEMWLAMAAGFGVTLSLSMFGYARGFVNLLARTAHWMLVSTVLLSGLWLAFQFLR